MASRSVHRVGPFLYSPRPLGPSLDPNLAGLTHVPIKEGLQSIIKCLKAQDLNSTGSNTPLFAVPCKLLQVLCIIRIKLQGSHCGWPTKFHDFSMIFPGFQSFFQEFVVFFMGYVYPFYKINKVKWSNFYQKKKNFWWKFNFFFKGIHKLIFLLVEKNWKSNNIFLNYHLFWEGFISKLYRTKFLSLPLLLVMNWKITS